MEYLTLDFMATDRPGEARACIRVRESGYALTDRVVGPGELEIQINQLQAELEEIRREGKAKFERAKKLWLAPNDSN
jgi:molecular chaperone GrpE (heat shock protein)